MNGLNRSKIQNKQSEFNRAENRRQKNRSYFERINDFFKEIDPMAFVTGISLLTLSVITLIMSMFGFIRYFWLAAFISMFASVCTMLSLFFMYELVKKRKTQSNIIREAIHRAVNFRN